MINSQFFFLFIFFSLISSMIYSNEKELSKNFNPGKINSKFDSYNKNFKDTNGVIRLIYNENSNLLKKHKIVSISELKYLLNNAIELNFYSKIISENQLLYSVNSDLLFNFICEVLSNIAKENFNNYYNYDFQFILLSCSQYNYTPNIKLPNSVKFVNSFTQNDYFHLFNATWNKSNIFQKMFLFIFLILNFFGIWKLFDFIKRK